MYCLLNQQKLFMTLECYFIDLLQKQELIHVLFDFSGRYFFKCLQTQTKGCKRVARSVFQKHFTSLDTPITRQRLASSQYLEKQTDLFYSEMYGKGWLGHRCRLSRALRNTAVKRQRTCERCNDQEARTRVIRTKLSHRSYKEPKASYSRFSITLLHIC